MQGKDSLFMLRSLKLARKAQGWTNPNPLVGAVIVKNSHIIGEGYHKRIGESHAELEALNTAHENPEGSTIYLNLEPCCHYGKTAPCTTTLIKAGVKRVVYAVRDPDPKVNGKGARLLKKAGIEVTEGILKDEATMLNEQFITYHKKGRPFIAIKLATSLDGKIATSTGDSKWITNEKARKHARGLRGIYQAVLVGINTILKDNSHLGTRNPRKRDPVRIILDSKLRIPLTAKVLRDKNVIIATSKNANRKKLQKLTQEGFTVLQFPQTAILVKALLEELGKREIIGVLVEGGSKVLGSFLDAKLVDKVYVYHAPVFIGGEKSISAIGGKGIVKIKSAVRLERITRKRFNDNLLTIGYITS